MAYASGKLRHRVRIDQLVDVLDSSGDPLRDEQGATVRDWEEVATVWAAIEPLSAREFIQSAAMQSQISARLVIRYRSGLDAAMRMVHIVNGVDASIYNPAGFLADKESGLEYLTIPVVYIGEAEAAPPPPPDPLVVTGDLPDGIVGEAYTGSLSISGGVAPYTIPDYLQPPGLVAAIVGSTVEVTGTPTDAFTDPGYVDVADSLGITTRAATDAIIDEAPFNPLTRFADGQQGIIVDLNDLTTLWQDTARTTPVTAAGQTVRGITDLSPRGNHLSDATGWLLSNDGSNNYLTTNGTSVFSSSPVVWGSDKASMFFGVKNNPVVTSTLISLGTVTASVGTFEVGFFSGGLLTYRRGAGSFGGRGMADVGSDVMIGSSVLNIAGTTHATENPYLRDNGTDPALSDYGTGDTGGGNFGTFSITIGSGVNSATPGLRRYSFFVVADDSTLEEVIDGEAWTAVRSGVMNFSAPAPTFLDTGEIDDEGDYVRTSAFARADYETTATAMSVSAYSTSYASFPDMSELGVFVDGEFNQYVTPAANGAFSAQITLPPGNKVVSFCNGLTTSPDQSFDTLGTWFVGASASAEMTVSAPAPTGRLLIYGDSIAVGGNSDAPVTEAWAMLVRDAYAPDSVAVEGFGYRSFFIDASDGTKRASFVAKLLAYNPDTLWIAIGTNDYGLNNMTAPAFGTAYAAVLDDLHAALPGLQVYCQTPIVRSVEAANGSGYTLGNFRTAIASAVATRTSFATLVDGTTFISVGALPDGVHPDTAGHVLYANAVRSVLGI